MGLIRPAFSRPAYRRIGISTELLRKRKERVRTCRTRAFGFPHAIVQTSGRARQSGAHGYSRTGRAERKAREAADFGVSSGSAGEAGQSRKLGHPATCVGRRPSASVATSGEPLRRSHECFPDQTTDGELHVLARKAVGPHEGEEPKEMAVVRPAWRSQRAWFRDPTPIC